jgi:uncharacterized protein YecT (DUF1311 family)
MLRSSFLLVAAVGITAFLSPAPAHGDDMSDMADWCTKATAPSSVVICSDLELRRMAVIRNKIFAGAQASFTPDDMKDLSEDQNHWIHEYSADCGAAVNGPPVSLPVRQDIIDCFKQAGRERVAELVRNVRDVIPNGPVNIAPRSAERRSSTSTGLVSPDAGIKDAGRRDASTACWRDGSSSALQ